MPQKYPLFLVLSACALLSASAWAQSAAHCQMFGQWLPVEEVRGKTPYVFDGDEVIRSSAEALALFPSSEFAPGYVDVEVVLNKRPGVVSDNGLLHFTSPRSFYRFKASLVAENDLEDCYYVLHFDKYGESVYVCKSIGDLQAGRPHTIEVFMRVNFEMPQRLHIFSGLGEVRTSLVPAAYEYQNGQFTFAGD